MSYEQHNQNNYNSLFYLIHLEWSSKWKTSESSFHHWYLKTRCQSLNLLQLDNMVIPKCISYGPSAGTECF